MLDLVDCCFKSDKSLMRLTDLQVLVYEETEYESLTEDIVAAAQVSSFIKQMSVTE